MCNSNLTITQISKKAISIIILLSITLCINLIECTSDNWKGEEWKENGIQIIKNPETGILSSNKIKLIEKFAIGKENDSQNSFFKIRNIKISSEGNIYILDSGNFRVAVFDKKGYFLFQFGRSGSGPGEFKDPIDLCIDSNDNVYVLDSSNRRVTKYSATGNYRYSFILSSFAYSLDLIDKKNFIITEWRTGAFGIFGNMYNTETQDMKTPIEIIYQTKVKIPLRTGISLEEKFQSLIDNNIYVAVSLPYEIRKYNKDGLLIKRIFKEDNRIKEPIIKLMPGGSGISIEDNGSAGPCFLTSNGIIVNGCTWYPYKSGQKSKETAIDFFNKQGKYLGSYKLPNKQKMIAIDIKDRLYFLESEPFERIIQANFEIDNTY